MAYRFQMSFDAKIKFLFGSPFPWRPVRVSIHLRLASDDSPIFLRSIFDRRTELERRLNGRSTEDERRTNGERTEDERSLNGARTELERSSNGARTELERISNGGWTEDERRTIRKIYRRNCWLDCDTVSLLMIFQELIKVDFGTFLLEDRLYNTLQKSSAYKDFNAECRRLSDLLHENNFVATTWESG